MPDFEMPYFIDGGGNKGYFKDSTARDGLSDITDKMDIKEVAVNWPSSGTVTERATNVITQIITNTTFTKQFTIIDIRQNNAEATKLGQILYSAVSAANYGMGLYFSYYTTNFYKFSNAAGTITVSQMTDDVSLTATLSVLDNLCTTAVNLDGTPQNLYTLFKGLPKNRLNIRKINGTQSSTSLCGGAAFTAIGNFSSNNYGWVFGFSDRADCGFSFMAVNYPTVYVQKPTVTVTSYTVS